MRNGASAVHGRGVVVVAALAAAAGGPWALAAEGEAGAAAAGAASGLAPVREVAVFKDGHAYVVHEGSAKTNEAGDVVFDRLPAPILGTFWAYSTDQRASLKSVTAAPAMVEVERTAASVADMLKANAGAEVIITEADNRVTEGTIIESGAMLMLQTAEGVRVIPVGQVRDATFRQAPKKEWRDEEPGGALTLDLEWPGGRAEEETQIGLMYVQRGLRWIPNYRVNIDSKGALSIEMQATIINEMVDLENATVHLVIGAPSFLFKTTPDPMALQETMASLSMYFRDGGAIDAQFSNMLMSQMSRMGEHRAPGQGGAAGGASMPEGLQGEEHEDYFVFTLEGVTLKKGARMQASVSRFEATYTDAYTLDLPVAPPPDLWRNLNTEQTREAARMLSRPKVEHALRIRNTSNAPFTTAPALIMRGGKALGQSMLTYTSVGGTVDLPLTAAMDIRVEKSDVETRREPNAVVWQGNSYAQVDLAGNVTLENFRSEPVTVEVTRHVAGQAISAGQGGEIRMINMFEDDLWLSAGSSARWWGSWSWPNWWAHVNGVGRVTWTVPLKAGEKASLDYTWRYHWR